MLGEVVEVAIVRTGAQPTAARVKERCRKLLANFKVPHRVHFLDELPRTPTGKVQKQLIAERIRAAPAPAGPRPPRPCRRQRRRAIAQTVAEVVTTYMATLTSERIDHDRPLFDAGLDSLGALELIEQLEQRFSLEVPPTLLYDHPTIRELAAYFASQDAPAPCAGSRVAARSRRAAEPDQLLLAPGDRPPRPARSCSRWWLSASSRRSSR